MARENHALFPPERGKATPQFGDALLEPIGVPAELFRRRRMS